MQKFEKKIDKLTREKGDEGEQNSDGRKKLNYFSVPNTLKNRQTLHQ